MIVANHLTKQYGSVTVLDDLTFTVEPGESLALWGANGAGKTTVIRCLLGIHPCRGEIHINGIDVRRHSKQARAKTGYVPQEVTFYDLSVDATLAFYARLKKVAPERIDTVLKQMQLADQRHKSTSALSGGMKQRLALAVALLADPPLLILDEPTANLDAQAQLDFARLLRNLNRDGKTILFSSHRLEEVATLARRVLVLEAGKLRHDWTPLQLAEELGIQQWLRLDIPETSQQQTAIRALADEGYTYSPNGRAVYVHIAEKSKMAVLKLLADAAVSIDDFDLTDRPDIVTEVRHD